MLHFEYQKNNLNMERFFPTRAVHQREIHGSGNRCGSARRNSGCGNTHSCSFGIQSVLSMERLQVVSYRAGDAVAGAGDIIVPPCRKHYFVCRRQEKQHTLCRVQSGVLFDLMPWPDPAARKRERERAVARPGRTRLCNNE